jgi:hypothetical protein
MIAHMEHEYLEPAASIIDKLGGVDAAAEAAGVDRSRVRRWRSAKDKGGTGGLIPSRHHQPLMQWAREKGRPLRPEDFFFTGSGQAA